MNGDMIKKFRGHIGEVCSVQFASNGKYICSGSHDESIRVWETWTGECIRILDAHSDTVNCVSFSPGSDQLCSCGADGRVHLWVSSTSLI
jgi:COMPASS component SWD3